MARSRVRREFGRASFPFPSTVETLTRIAYAYARDQHGLRSRRPPLRYLRRNASFLAAGLLGRGELEAEMSGLDVLLNTADWTMARSVYASGDWDPLLVGTAYAALEHVGRDVRGKTFVEIGANFGVYCLPAVAEHGFARAIAYEPDPPSFDLLQRNIARNDLTDRVTALPVALSDAPGEMTLHRSRTNAGDNRVVPLDEAAPTEWDVVVRTTTLDREVEAGTIPLADVGLVWLDVQGHEADVLAGASMLLRSDVPVVLEYCSGMMTDRGRMDETIATAYDAFVDLGWSTLTNRIRVHPASAIREVLPPDRPIETDLLLLKR